MTKISGRYIVSVVGFAAMWVIWNESFSVSTVLAGVALSVSAVEITNRFLLRDRYHQVFALPLFTVLRYIGVLFLEIFRSGVHAIAITLTGKLNVGVVHIPTEVRSPLHAVLVANAITLTPGTVTIETRPGQFTVVWIDCSTTDAQEAADAIKARFEDVFSQKGRSA